MNRDAYREIAKPHVMQTVGELKALLTKYPDDMPVRVFCPFDSEGPETWEPPRAEEWKGELRLQP